MPRPMLKAFDEGRIFGSTHGRPPFRVLALPGWLHTARDFDAALSRLSVGSIALDLPGFGGGTPEPEAPMGAAGYAGAVNGVLERELGPDPAVVVGHSFGGRVALHLAAERPDRVRALVLTGVPNLFPREGAGLKPPARYRLARALHRRGLLSEGRMESLRRRSGSSDYRNAPSKTMRDVLVAAANEHYEHQLRALSCKVELVWGDRDDQAPLAQAERAATLLGDRANLTVLPGVDHFVPTRAPEALAEAIERCFA